MLIKRHSIVFFYKVCVVVVNGDNGEFIHSLR